MIDTSKLRPWQEQYGINRTGQTGQFGSTTKPPNQVMSPDYFTGNNQVPPDWQDPGIRWMKSGDFSTPEKGPLTPTGDKDTSGTSGNDPYSMDWLKNYEAVYAKNWGGPQGSEQAWYRTPNWAGGILWNPYWGWQSGSNIKSQYSGGPLSSEQFYGMGLTRNPGEDWKQYYQDLTGMTTEEGLAKQQANYGGTTTTTGATNMTTGTPASYGYDFSSYFPEYGQATTLQLPQELDWASSALGELSATGRPADWAPWYQQAKGVAQTDIMDAIKQAAEQAGLSGTRWSTPMGRTAQDISGRRMQELGTEYTQQQLGAMENAANRSLTAAQGLGNIAQQRWNMPLQYASQAMGMGQNMQQQYQNMFNPQYQEFLRTAAENNPWLNQAMGATSLTGQYTPQTYQQSFLTNILGMLPALLGLL